MSPSSDNTGQRPETITCREFDLSELTTATLGQIDLAKMDVAVVYIPMWSIGVTNSHIDICEDYIEASWAAETLAASAQHAEIAEEYLKEKHRTRLRLTLNTPDASFPARLRTVITLYEAARVDGVEQSEAYETVRDSIADHEEEVARSNPLLPEIVDAYFANLVAGAYHQMRYDAPDYYEEQIRKYPERELGFHRSAYSGRLGGTCYASPDSWLLPKEVGLDIFFATTGQNYRLAEFSAGEILVVGGQSFVLCDGMVTYFPMRQYFKSRVCASFDQRLDQDLWPPDRFSWDDAAFTHSVWADHIREHIPESLRAPNPSRENCIVHSTGTLIAISDGRHSHILYDTKPLNPVATKGLYEKLGEAIQAVGTAIGLSGAVTLDWATLNDEQFEQLCYDIIFAHPKFDSSTIRKLGTSRSRDGGRDIEVWETPLVPGGQRKKWVFQCKLTRSKSLGATKVTDIGDMLDQAGARGFGVMTSALIDATLYAKLDSVCGARSIEQLNFSALELGRALIRNASIRKKYFSG